MCGMPRGVGGGRFVSSPTGPTAGTCVTAGVGLLPEMVHMCRV